MRLLILPETITAPAASDAAAAEDVYFFSCPGEVARAQVELHEEEEQDDWFIGSIDVFAAAVHGWSGAA